MDQSIEGLLRPFNVCVTSTTEATGTPPRIYLSGSPDHKPGQARAARGLRLVEVEISLAASFGLLVLRRLGHVLTGQQARAKPRWRPYC
jgi:hypothetical protein